MERHVDPERIISRLEPLVTEARLRRMQAVLASRSDHVAFVFERMIDPHNLSAALRSLDAFSFQDVHLIQPGERLDLSAPSLSTPGLPTPGLSKAITIGADRWLTLHKASSVQSCVETLLSRGYALYASHLGEEEGAGEGDSEALPLEEIDFSRPTALVFGNEHLGVSEEMLAAVPGRFRIPMLGFVQSLNLSVAVAISAHHARREIERMSAGEFQQQAFGLGAERQRKLYAQWLRQSVRNAEKILAEGEEVRP